MIFNTFAYYFVFLFPSAILFHFLSPKWKPRLLVVSGIGFFTYFSFTALAGLWGAACVVIFLYEALFSRLYHPGSRWCAVGVATSILILCVFKYWNFATGLLTIPLGHNDLLWKGAFLPLGVSFFTFEFIHYAIDRKNGRTEAGSVFEYMAFIFFFPTLVAGPIKRYQDFLPCLREPSQDWVTDWQRGLTRILVGLAKKFVIADFLTAFTDNLTREGIATAPRWILLVWLFAYGIKIYVDFSAYSDIAIGSGRLFGIKIPENFSWPYFQTNIANFWRHWHMSLYKWLVDYVFIPLGGSRGTLFQVCRNTLLVMLVSGIWHGAGLNFVVWGLWHGVLLVGHRLWKTYVVRDTKAPPKLPLQLAGWLLTFVLVNLGWAFFVMDLPTALFYFERLLLG